MPPDPHGLNPHDTHLVVVGAMFVLFLSALEQTIVATALPAIMADLGRIDLGSWVITAYLLSAICATPVFGKLSDLYGRASIMRACIALFVLGSVWCALAPGMTGLVAARALQGIGGGGLMTLAQTVIGDAVPPRERGRYAGYFSVVWMTASLVGPVLGGVLAQHIGWRWIFWINLPLGALATALGERALRRIVPVRREAHVDVLGIVLLAGASFTVLWAVSFARAVAAGERLPVVAAVAGIVLCAAFWMQQLRAREPIVPPHFLAHEVITPVLGAGFLVLGGYVGFTVLVPLYYQVALGRSAAESGLLLVPTMLTASLSALFAGRYTRQHGRYRRPPLVTMPLALAGLVALGILAPYASLAATAVLSAVVALGVGPLFPCSMVAAQASVQRRDMGAVSGAVGLSRSLGAALVTGLVVALLLALVERGLPLHGAMASLEDLVRRPLDADTRPVLLHAFSMAFFVLAAIFAAGLATFARVEDRPLPAVLAP